MKENELSPVVANKEFEIDFFGRHFDQSQLLAYYLATWEGNGTPENKYGPERRGWKFSGVGNPEFWKFQDRLLVPGGNLLDVGMGFGRSSMFFALNGMNVTGFEIEEKPVEVVQALKEAYDLPISLHNEDITAVDFGKDEYDTAVMEFTFQHFPSKEAAFKVLEKVIRSIKPGGHIWFRTGGQLDSGYEDIKQAAWYEPRYVQQLSDEVFRAPCSCSGEERTEFHLFLDPVEVLSEIGSQTRNLVHTQVFPEQGKLNIQFGESYRPEYSPDYIGGAITVLAQK